MDDKSALESASRLYGAMLAADAQRRTDSARLLATELAYFERAMILQVSAFLLLRPHLPFSERKPSAANAPAFSIFDHLRHGCRALLENYSLVSMTLGRNIFEAIVFLTAIGVGIAGDFRGEPNEGIDSWLTDWWRDKFRPGTVQRLVGCVDSEMRRSSRRAGQSEWARSTNTLWRIVRSWAHAAWVPIGSAGAPIQQSDSTSSTLAISFGGQLPSPEMQRLVGTVYSQFAVDALFALGLAFTPQLAECTEWWQRKDQLVAEHQQWSRTIDLQSKGTKTTYDG